MFEQIYIPKVECHIMFVVFIIFVVGGKTEKCWFFFFIQKTSIEDEQDQVVYTWVSVQQHAYNWNKVEKLSPASVNKGTSPL